MNAQVILAKIKAYPVAVSLVVAAIIMALVAYFRQDSLADAQDQSKSLDDESKTMTNNIVFGGNLKANLAQLREAQKDLTVALIDPNNIIENQQYFYGFERIDGLHIIDPTQTPVSYTHLDVYKRQWRNCGKRHRVRWMNWRCSWPK